MLVAETPNQFATAGALNTLAQTGESLSVFNAILFSNAAGARAAFDQLSGETHASVSGALADTSRAPRDGAASRIESLFAAVGQGADLPVGEDRFLASGAWVEGFGTFGRADGNGNAAGADRDVGGVFGGIDRAVSPNATLGFFGGYGRTEIEARNGSATVDAAHVGAHGPLELSGGAAPAATLSFVSGSLFTVQGAPNVSLGLDYVGQFGEDTTDNGFRIGLSARF